MHNRTRKPTHPGVLIRLDYMVPLALSVTALVAQLGVSRKHLSNVINEKVGVTPDMDLRLSPVFRTTPDLWLNLQRNHDLWLAEHSDTGWSKVDAVPGLVKALAE